MATGYVRQDVSNSIANGNITDADPIDAEFDALEAAFNASTGHTHDGTTSEGAPITKVGPAQDVVISLTNVEPKTHDTVSIGSNLLRFKHGYFSGLVGAVLGFVGNLTGNVLGNVTGNVTGNLTGNASTATTLATGRTIALSGAATASGVSFNGGSNISLNVTALAASALTGRAAYANVPEFIFGKNVTVSNIGTGDEVPHTSIASSSTALNGSTNPSSGTWRALGNCPAGAATLFVKVA